MPHEWATLEPDNKNNAENCIALNCEGKLADVRCDEPRPYICYREHSYVDTNMCGTTDPGKRSYKYKILQHFLTFLFG